MQSKKNTFSCLTDREIGSLAVQILTREGTGGDYDKGSLDKIPGSLFSAKGKDRSIEHLEACRECRERLIREVRYLREYAREYQRTDQSDRVREHLAREWGKGGDIRILRFDSPDTRREPEFSLAASTSGAGNQGLRFSTASGDLIIRDTGDKAAGRKALILIGNEKFAKNSEVIIRGERYLSDEEGYLRFREDIPDLDSTDVIVVRPGSYRSD